MSESFDPDIISSLVQSVCNMQLSPSVYGAGKSQRVCVNFHMLLLETNPNTAAFFLQRDLGALSEAASVFAFH